MPDTPNNEGYRGTGLQFLNRYGAKVGQRVKIHTIDGLEVSGLLIPRYEYADDEHIVLKLKSGYNIGLKVSAIRSLIVLDEVESSKNSPTNIEALHNIIPNSNQTKKKLLLLSTGGTIASKVDYRTGGVHPVLSASDLYSAIPELDEIASVDPDVVFSISS
ncbi:MAG: asparaginase domain-containing protein, partial [Thaumarchaeota archaeon]|nr:asparaginase domain-containing protein [Nitrososphaerota archaeon]